MKTKLDNKAPPSTPVASGPAAPASAATEAAPILETKGSNDAFGGDAAPMAPDGNVPVVLPGAVDGIHTNFPVNDLGAIPASGRDPLGFRLDGDSLGGMRVTARRISNSDRAGFEIVGALAPSAAEMIGNRLKKAGGAAQPFQFSAADDQAGVLTHTGTPWSPGAQATRVEGDGFVVELVGKTPEALKGTLRIRVFGSDAEATKALAKARKAFGLDALFTPPAQKSERRLILESMLQQVKQSSLQSLSSASTVTELESALAEAGVDAERIAGVGLRRVYESYFAAVDPALAEACEAKGARYLYSTLASPERVLDVLRGGQKSSVTRFDEGILIKGESSVRDIETGGGRAVFTRLVTQKAIDARAAPSMFGDNNQFMDWSGRRPYKLIINRRVLGRCDFWGHQGDNYGRSTNLTDANRGANIVAAIDAQYSNSNELMFPVGNDPQFIDYVVTASAEQRDKLIAHLKANGIDSWNDKPLERFIRVEQRFFTLPSDRTLANAVRDAARQAVESAAGPIAREVAKTAITHSADKAKSDALATAVTAAEAHVSVLMKDALRTSAAFGVNALLPPSGFNGDLDGALATALDAVKAKVEAESSSVEGKAKVEAHQALERLARDELEAHLSAALLAIAKAQLPGAGLDGIAATIASTAPQSLDVSAMTAAARRQATSAARAPIEHDLHAAAEWAAKIEASAKCKEAAEAAATAAAKTWAEEATTDSEHAASVAEQQASVDVGAVASDAIESTVAEIVEREASVVASVKAGMLAMAVAEDAMLKLPDTAAQIAAAAPAAAEQLVAACVAEDLGIDLEHATDAIVDSIVEKMLADGKLKAFEFGWGSDSVWNHSPSSVGGMGGLGSMMGASMPSEGPKDFSWWGACTGHEMHTKTAFGEGAYESHGSNYFPYHEKADLDSLVKSPPSDAQKAEFDAIFEALSPQPKSDLHALFPDGKVPGKKTSDDKQ